MSHDQYLDLEGSAQNHVKNQTGGRTEFPHLYLTLHLPRIRFDPRMRLLVLVLDGAPLDVLLLGLFLASPKVSGLVRKDPSGLL